MSKNNQKAIRILAGVAAGFLAATYAAVLNGIVKGSLMKKEPERETGGKKSEKETDET